MTIGLQVTDGTTTVDLNDGSYYEIIELDIGFGAISAQFVTGSVKLYINGTKAQIQAELAAIQKLLQQAVDYQGTGEGGALYDAQGDVVYLNYRTDGTEVYYRSPIRKASLAFSVESFVILNFDCGGIEITIDFERRNWWEGAEAQLAVSTQNDTATTNAVTVYNPQDGGGDYCDYIDVAYTQITGDLPAATRLEIKNTYNSVSSTLYYLWIGVNFTNPANATYILEAEDATGASSTSEATASQGKYVKAALGSGAEADLLTWAFTSAQLGYAAGRWYKAVVKFWGSSVFGVLSKFRIQLEYNGLPFWKSGLVSLDANYAILVRDLLTFQLPPTLQGQITMAGIDIVLRGYQTTGASVNVPIDYLELLPVDQYRMLMATIGCPYGRRVVDDGITPLLFEDNPVSGDKTPNWIGYASPIMLQPGRNHRIHFIQNSTAYDTAEIDRTIEVKLYYRPRRLTI